VRAEEETMKPTLVQGVLLAGLGLLLAPACSTHHPGPYHRGGGYQDYGRVHDGAYGRGYHHGVKAGARDWKRNRRFDLWRHDRYRSGDSGYRSRYGPRSQYCRSYRSGFRAGYERGYRPARHRRAGRGGYGGPRH
jgi:hypothetical protein